MSRALRQHAKCVAIFSLLARRVLGAGFDSMNNVAVYWGQNSYGAASGGLEQQTLATYCANASVDIIPMAFMVQVTTGQGKQPVLNFANQQNNCTLFTGTQLINCPSIGEDIKTCQQKFNKTILISIGGATYTEGGFASEDAAVSAANLVWSTFGPTTNSPSNTTNATTATNTTSTAYATSTGTSTATSRSVKRDAAALRPFGDAVIDGFDFDFETSVQNVVPFANQLRTLMKADTSKPYYLTAAPQCPYPDAADNAMLNGNVTFDAVFVQFYNNFCGVQSYIAGAATQNNFNFETWDTWAKNGSANSNVKIFLGVPAGQTGAGSGYEPASQLSAVIEYSKTFPSFGGVMMWDMSQAFANPGFLDGVKNSLGSAKTRRRRVRQSLRQHWQW